MKKTRIATLTIIAALVATGFVLTQPGCTNPSDVQQISEKTEPLRVRRAAGGKVESITFAQAMDYHHEHEDHGSTVTSATPKKSSKTEPADDHDHDHDHDDGLCVGIATGYQAIRYATEALFPNETPSDADFELSVAGAMRGVWDVMKFYTGRELTKPKKKDKGMSLKSFTFTARRISTGKTLTFRLRSGFIPTEFFAMKNRGVSCGDEALEALKKQAARKILSSSPQECFERLEQGK